MGLCLGRSRCANSKKVRLAFPSKLKRSAEARRQVDCLLLTNDLAYVPDGRRKPDFAAARYLRELAAKRDSLSSLLKPSDTKDAAIVPLAWQRPKLAGRDFLMPWNITPEFWKLYDKPAAERPLYPFNAEPIEEFVQKYKGARDVPLFSSKLVVPVIYINNLPEYLKEGSPFLRYLRETKVPFAILINYGSAEMSAEDGQAAWKLLNGEFKDQFLGWMSGESVGYVWEQAPAELKISASMSRPRIARSASRLLHERHRAQVGRDFSHRNRRDVGQADSRAINFQHFVCACAQRMGRAPAGHGDCRGAADVCHAHRFHARRRADNMAELSLLSRAKLRRHGHHLYETAKLRRARQLLSLALWRHDGPVAFVVSQELLPLLHVGRVGDLSRAGLRSVFQARPGRA